MVTSKIMVTTVCIMVTKVVIVCVMMGGAEGRVAEIRRTTSSVGRERELEKLPFIPYSRRNKRSAYVDSSCKGLYSRTIWKELLYVCEDCSNVFRKNGLQAMCRNGCFASDIFDLCLKGLERNVNFYQAMATSLRGS